MRTLNSNDVDFLNDLKNLYLKHGIEIEIFLPTVEDAKDYAYEIIGKENVSFSSSISFAKLYAIPNKNKIK